MDIEAFFFNDLATQKKEVQGLWGPPGIMEGLFGLRSSDGLSMKKNEPSDHDHNF